MKFIVIGLASAFALVACGKGNAPETQDTPAVVDTSEAVEKGSPVPDAPAVKPETVQRDGGVMPDKLTRDEAYLEAEINFPRGIGQSAPEIAAILLKEARLDMADMERTAQQDAREGMPFSLSSSWEISGQSGDLMSLVKSTYTFTGGAHGNSYLGGRIYEISSGARVQIVDIFTDEATAAKLIIPAVRRAIAIDKAERFGVKGGPNATLTGEVSDAIPMEGELPTEIALVASTAPGKFGGLRVMYSPYDIGAYAEGSYEAVVAQDVFAAALKPAYVGLFAGRPATPPTD